jgi:hypothetical protein
MSSNRSFDPSSGGEINELKQQLSGKTPRDQTDIPEVSRNHLEVCSNDRLTN